MGFLYTKQASLGFKERSERGMEPYSVSHMLA